jgi:Leucine-rich repeat (LRR) protein
MNDDCLEQLIFSDLLKSIEYMNLSSCGLSSESLQRILLSENLQSLEYLIFAKNEVKNLPKITDAKTGSIKSLQFLDLRENRIFTFGSGVSKGY